MAGPSVADRKAWDQSVFDVAKARGWKRVGGGFHYQVRGGYIFELNAQIPAVDYRPHGTVRAKPLYLDPVFWAITGMDELNAKPVSFRINGAFTVPVLSIASVEYGIEDTAATVVDRLDKQFASLAPALETSEDFESVIEMHAPPTNGADLTTHVTWLIAMRREAAAIDLIDDFIAGGRQRGGFSFPGGTFEDLARNYLDR